MTTMDSKLDKFANGCLLLVPFFVIGLHRAVTIVLLASFVIWLCWVCWVRLGLFVGAPKPLDSLCFSKQRAYRSAFIYTDT